MTPQVPLAPPPLQLAEIGDLELCAGDRIEDCRVGFRAAGEQAADRSNVVVVPSFYMGDSADVFNAGVIGPGCAYDTDRFHVVVVDALGDGVSSSPSNSRPQPGVEFPEFDIADMVVSQHRLLVEHLGLTSVYAVSGISMGGMQTYEWMARYPDFAKRFLAIQGTPWLSIYNRVLFRARTEILDHLEDEPASMDHAAGLLTALDILTAWTPEFVSSMFAELSVDEARAAVAEREHALSYPRLLDIACQTVAFGRFSILQWGRKRRSVFGGVGDLDAMAIVCERDLLVDALPNHELAASTGMPCNVIRDDAGHMAMGDSQSAAAEMTRLARAFLSAIG